MTEQPKNGSGFLKPFAVGLVVGLVVGGLGGSYLSGLSESSAPKLKQVPPKTASGAAVPRDARPGDTTEPPPAPTGTAPTNVPLPEKPAQPK